MLPVDYFAWQLIRDIYFIHPLSKLNTRTPNYVLLLGIGLGLEMEKIAEEFKMELDAQKSFAQMHEDRNMNEGIGGKMMQLDSVSNTEYQKRNLNKEDPSRVRNKWQKQQFHPYFHTGGCGPGLDATGPQI